MSTTSQLTSCIIRVKPRREYGPVATSFFKWSHIPWRQTTSPASQRQVGFLPHAQVMRLRSGTGRPLVAKDGQVRRPCPNQPRCASPRSPRSDNPIPHLVPRTGNGASLVRGLVSTRLGSEESGTNAPFGPGACATNLRFACPFG